MARLAVITDLDYITERAATIGQLYSERWARELLTDKRCIVAVEPPTGYFWVQLSQDPTVVLAGFDIAEDDAQLIRLYKCALTEALKRWPQAAYLESHINPAWCQVAAPYRAGTIAKMVVVGTDLSGSQVYRVSRANVAKALK